MLKKREVFILKASADDEDGSSYTNIIGNSGFFVKCMSPLDFEYCNLDILKEHLQKPEEFSGIIFSSPRSVKAVAKSAEPIDTLHPQWRKLPMFVVGEATKRTLENDLGLLGQCGHIENAVGLGELIVQGSYDHPLLYPCSDLRRDTLTAMLSSKGISFTEIRVYCTRSNPLLKEELTNATRGGIEFPEFMVFFSPSGVKNTLPVLRLLNAPFDEMKFIAIGNATLSALKETNINVWSCATKPSPEGLLKALLEKTLE